MPLGLLPKLVICSTVAAAAGPAVSRIAAPAIAAITPACDARFIVKGRCRWSCVVPGPIPQPPAQRGSGAVNLPRNEHGRRVRRCDRLRRRVPQRIAGRRDEVEEGGEVVAHLAPLWRCRSRRSLPHRLPRHTDSELRLEKGGRLRSRYVFQSYGSLHRGPRLISAVLVAAATFAFGGATPEPAHPSEDFDRVAFTSGHLTAPQLMQGERKAVSGRERQ